MFDGDSNSKGSLQGSLLAAPVSAASMPRQPAGPTSVTADDAVRMAVERGETVVLVGEFHPGYLNYSKALAVFALVIMVWGIPFLFLLPCIFIGIQAKFNSFKIVLTDKSVMFLHGSYACCCTCWSESERIVPLEKITDCTWKQGWLQRAFDIDQLDIRTAAGNMNAGEAGGGADISLVGLRDSKNFRTALMRAKDQRDHFLATGVTTVQENNGEGAAAPVAMNISERGGGQAMYGGVPPAAITAEGAVALTSIDQTLREIKDFLFSKGDCFGAAASALDESTDIESKGADRA
eukprot:COSAG05_NODE_604_length_8399_cov_6.936145_3_plen_293_part_00